MMCVRQMRTILILMRRKSNKQTTRVNDGTAASLYKSQTPALTFEEMSSPKS